MIITRIKKINKEIKLDYNIIRHIAGTTYVQANVILIMMTFTAAVFINNGFIYIHLREEKIMTADFMNTLDQINLSRSE